MSVVSELPHHMFLLPLLWLVLQHGAGRPVDLAWWWVAAAFGISWLANTVQHYQPPDQRWIMSAIYPVSQAAIVSAVVLSRLHARRFLLALIVVAVGSVLFLDWPSATLLLRFAAWGGIVWFVLPLPLGRLRVVLVATFGGALLSWVAYLLLPGNGVDYPHGTPSWWVNQSCWALGIVLFCWASRPVVRVV